MSHPFLLFILTGCQQQHISRWSYVVTHCKWKAEDEFLIRTRSTTYQLFHHKEQQHQHTHLEWFVFLEYDNQQGKLQILFQYFSLFFNTLDFNTQVRDNLHWFQAYARKLCGYLTTDFQSTYPKYSISQEQGEETLPPVREVAKEPLFKGLSTAWWCGRCIVPNTAKYQATERMAQEPSSGPVPGQKPSCSHSWATLVISKASLQRLLKAAFS